ncbi:MAG: lamin tail domain-containing protein, partial [Chloroflexi bacterium]
MVLLSGTLLLLVWAVLVAGRRATAQTVPAIVINEIQYNPRSGDAGEEYIELYNAGSTPVDLSGWAFVDGIVYTFTAGTVISPGGYLVVGHDPATIEATYGISGVLGPFASGKLSNGGERVALADDLGTLVDGVTYDDHHPWPEEPDGNGPSLELINPAFDNDRPCSWAASSGLGTPGAPNSAYASGNVIHDAMRGFPPPDGIELSDMVTPAVVLDNEVYNILDDCLDLNHASAVIERNELHDCGNKGISIGWPSTTTLVNNLIYATEI